MDGLDEEEDEEEEITLAETGCGLEDGGALGEEDGVSEGFTAVEMAAGLCAASMDDAEAAVAFVAARSPASLILLKISTHFALASFSFATASYVSSISPMASTHSADFVHFAALFCTATAARYSTRGPSSEGSRGVRSWMREASIFEDG